MTPTVSPWPSNTIGYSFSTTEPGGKPSGYIGYAPFSAEQQSLTIQALKVWSDVANISFVAAPDQIVFSNWIDGTVYAGWGYYPAYGGDVWIKQQYADNLFILTHEIGHALGLEHNDFEPSIMASTGTIHILHEPDIDAIQSLYGPKVAGTFNDDVLTGSNTVDVISAQRGNDTVHGRNGDDVIYGGKGNDWLYGDAGNDTIYGDLDDDIMFGGTGADLFVLNANSGNDWIVGFNSLEGDRVQVMQAYTIGSHFDQALITFADGSVVGFAGVPITSLGDWIW